MIETNREINDAIVGAGESPEVPGALGGDRLSNDVFVPAQASAVEITYMDLATDDLGPIAELLLLAAVEDERADA